LHPRQGQPRTTPAACRKDDPGSQEVPVPGTTTNGFTVPVHLPQGQAKRRSDDPGWIALALSPPSSANKGGQGQPASVPPYVRRRHGPCRHLPSSADAPDGPCRHPNDDALRPAFARGRLAGVSSCRSETRTARIARRAMRRTPRPGIEEIFEAQLQVLAATLRPSTINNCYRVTVRRFLRYLHGSHPAVRRLDQLQRDPHILGWLRRLAEEKISNKSRTIALVSMRRLLEALADTGQPVRDGLTPPQDFPPRDIYLPRPLAPEVDRLLQSVLRRIDDLPANALLLIRFTGMRARECLRLGRESLRYIGGNDWALHVPLGKLHTERWVPIDNDTRNIFARIHSLAGPIPPGATGPPDPLLVMPNGARLSYGRLRKTILDAARSIGSPPVGAHQLRHTFATELVRAGISLPALQHILGHSDINMTMRYVQVTQNDLQ